MNITIGQNIKTLRAKKQITQKQLAAYLGVTEQAVSRWESGSGFPDIQLLPSIASFFSVTTDDLLGLNHTEREQRLAEIRQTIREWNETGESSEETVAQSRLWAAEFPGEEDIQVQLADELCAYTMWDEKPKTGLLQEAEMLYRTLTETTNDPEFRNSVLEKLAALYAIGFRDAIRTEETADRLPSMKYSRESVKATVFAVWARDHGEPEMLCHTQDYIERLTDSLGTIMTQYVLQDIPNEPERWDEKIGYFEQILSLYTLVFGENALFYHERLAYLHRVIATYTVAQGKTEETLERLEKMADHALLADKAAAGDRYTSVFLDKLTYSGPTEDFDAYVVHNCSYWCRQRLDQNRYDSIRDTERFRAVCERLENAMK